MDLSRWYYTHKSMTGQLFEQLLKESKGALILFHQWSKGEYSCFVKTPSEEWTSKSYKNPDKALLETIEYFQNERSKQRPKIQYFRKEDHAR